MLRYAALLALSAGLSSATLIEYSDYNAWSTAELSQPGVFLATETFTGDQINTPGLSIVSTQGPVTPVNPNAFPGNGRIENNQWVDDINLNQYGGTRITYTGGELYGFYFQNWQASNPGLSLWGADANDHPELITPPVDGAWGFVSTDPFQSMFFSDDVGGAYFSFGPLTLADSSVTDAPEPDLVWLVGVGMLALLATKMRSS